jgi:hypothetical protein
MPITTKRWTNDPARTTTEVTHPGRVLRVEYREENRNHSPTLGWSDWRYTICTYAIVWLGEHGDIHEQIERVDVTNLFARMDSSTVSVEVDADIDPRAEVALLTWEAFEKAAEEKPSGWYHQPWGWRARATRPR